MKVLVTAELPPEPFNSLVREGQAGEIIQKIMGDLKPEHVYFTEFEGCRSCFMVIDMQSASEIPKYAEPFFLNFEAEVRFRIAMTPEDLGSANLDALGQKWG
jgi:hypothetical protein